VLTTIDLDNDAPRVTSKVDDVAANSNLATEMCASGGKPVAQVPPEFRSASVGADRIWRAS